MDKLIRIKEKRKMEKFQVQSEENLDLIAKQKFRDAKNNNFMMQALRKQQEQQGIY